MWEAFFIITGKGTISFASHVQCVSSCCFILASEIQSSFLQSKRPPRSWKERSMWRNLWWNLATVPEKPPFLYFLRVLGNLWVLKMWSMFYPPDSVLRNSGAALYSAQSDCTSGVTEGMTCLFQSSEELMKIFQIVRISLVIQLHLRFIERGWSCITE